jgi:flagellar hook assembly protein FlgD
MPNPVREKTRIKYTVPEAGKVDISIYNLYGQKVFTLISENKAEGMYTVDFDATTLPKGLYTGKLTVGGNSVNCKLLKGE